MATLKRKGVAAGAAAGGAPAGMHVLENRMASFKARKWPHGKDSIRKFAEAGWYHVAEEGSNDYVKCFMCSKGLDGWEKDEDPMVEHTKHSPLCPWVTKDREESRVATLQYWPHPASFKANARNLARAGWYLAATAESPDMTICYACELGLGGWEEEDDPMVEHRKRKPNCVVFVRADAAAAENAAAAAAPSTVRKPAAPKGATLKPVSVPAPAPAPVQEAVAMAVDAPIAAAPVPAPVVAPAPVPAPMAVDPAARAPAPAPAPVPAAPSPTPAPQPTVVAKPAPAPAPVSVMAPAPVPAPMPVMAPAPVPVMAPAPVPVMAPVPVPVPVPVPAPAERKENMVALPPLDYDPDMTVEQFLRSLLEKQVALLREDSEAQIKRFSDAARVTRTRLAELQPAPPQP